MGIEPTTLFLAGTRSSPLSYGGTAAGTLFVFLCGIKANPRIIHSTMTGWSPINSFTAFGERSATFPANSNNVA